MIAGLCNDSTAEVEESYNKFQERIQGNIAKQKEEREALERAAEEKRLKKEQKKKAKAEAKRKQQEE